MKHVIMVAMIEQYTDEVPEGAEVWGVNRTFKHQENLTKTFFFDSLEHFPPEYPEELNSLQIPVLTRRKYDEIPLSEPYPIEEVIQYFGLTYFTCTVAYMLAYAIWQGFKKITLHGMYHTLDSHEYMIHKPCVEYWIGVAVGHGVEVTIDDNCNLLKPHVWQSTTYGYVGQRNEVLAIQTMGAAYRGSIGYPVSFFPAEDQWQHWADDDTDRITAAPPEPSGKVVEEEPEVETIETDRVLEVTPA